MQQMYIDGIMKLAKLDKDSLEIVVKRLEKISEKFGFDIIISASIDESKLSDDLKKLVIVSL